MRRLVGLVVGVLVTAAVATGCGSGTVDGTPVAAIGKDALFDPCTELPPEALQAAGVDPAITDHGIAGVEHTGWKMCSWDGGPFTTSVGATALSIDDFKQKKRNIDFRDVVVGSRSALTYRVDDDDLGLECSLVFPSKQGTIRVWLLEGYSPHGRLMSEQPCDATVRIANALDPYLPSS